MLRVVREPRATLDAQARAVVPAQRLERQCEHHRIPQQWLEIDQISLEPADIVVQVVTACGVTGVVVHEQLLEVDLDGVLDRLQAPCALAHEAGLRRTRDENPFHDRLEPQIDVDAAALGNAQDLDAKPCRRPGGERQLALRPRAAAELVGVEHERRSRVEIAQGVTSVVVQAEPSGVYRRPRVTAKTCGPCPTATGPTRPVARGHARRGAR